MKMDKKLSASRGLGPADPQQLALPWIPLGAPTPYHRYRLKPCSPRSAPIGKSWIRPCTELWNLALQRVRGNRRRLQKMVGCPERTATRAMFALNPAFHAKMVAPYEKRNTISAAVLRVDALSSWHRWSAWREQCWAVVCRHWVALPSWSVEGFPSRTSTCRWWVWDTRAQRPAFYRWTDSNCRPWRNTCRLQPSAIFSPYSKESTICWGFAVAPPLWNIKKLKWLWKVYICPIAQVYLILVTQGRWSYREGGSRVTNISARGPTRNYVTSVTRK